MTEEDLRASREVREIADRAIRRLNVLEWVILGAAAVLALLAGAVAAFLLEAAFGFRFRPTWAVSSVLLFAVPAAVSWARERGLERGRRRGPAGDGVREGRAPAEGARGGGPEGHGR